MIIINNQYRLASRPKGLPKDSNWEYTNESVRELNDGELLIKILYISVDPAMRGWVNEGKSYIPPVEIGEVMRALGVGCIIASKNTNFNTGEYVSGTFGVQEYFISKGAMITKIDPQKAPLPLYLSTLGMPGMTAYFGLLEVGKPQAGDTVVISSAAGAVGAVVGQIAKIKGWRVVGIAGGKEKCQYIVNELGFDVAIDYTAGDIIDALREHCANGINVYFDNVGGDILDAVLTQIAIGARIVICGAISQYNNPDKIKGPANYLSLLVNRASMQGFVVFDFAFHYGVAIREIAGWITAGKLKSREDIVVGLETFPETFLKLFNGENFGKLILQLSES